MKFNTLHPIRCKKCEKDSTLPLAFDLGGSDDVISDIEVGREINARDGVYHTESECPLCKEPVTLCAYIKGGIFKGIYVE